MVTHPQEPLACGIDPGRYAIQVALRSPSRVYCNCSLPISSRGLAAFQELVPTHAEVVIEGFGTTGRLFFLELERAGYSLFELNPRVGKHVRFLAQEGRTDESDAQSIAQALFLSRRRSPLQFSEECESFFLLLRYYQRIRKDHARHVNRLHRFLSEAYGHAYLSLRSIFSLTSQRGKHFFHQYPSSQALLEAGKKALETFLPRDQIEAIWVTLPSWRSRKYLRILEREVRFLLTLLEEEEAYLREILQQLQGMVENHPEGKILRSIPGCGVVIAATLLAFLRDIHRFPTEGHFAGYCGLGKVVNQSGQGQWSRKRTMYHRVLRGIFFQLAFAGLRVSPLSQAYYQKKRREGKTHRQAVLALARYYARIVYALLREQRPYLDETTWQNQRAAKMEKKDHQRAREDKIPTHNTSPRGRRRKCSKEERGD